MRHLFLSFYLICFSLFAVSCSTLNSEPTSKLIVQVAVIDFISKAENPIRISQRIYEIAQDGKVLLDNENLPLGQIEKLIRDKIKWENLDTKDALLVDMLISTIRLEIEKGLDNQAIPNDVRITGNKVLNWIMEASRLAVAGMRFTV